MDKQTTNNIKKKGSSKLKTEDYTFDVLPDPLKDRCQKDVKPPPNMPLSSKLLFPNKDFIPDWNILKTFMIREGKIYKKDLLIIANAFINLVKEEPSLLKIDDPVIIVGDIHGQYYDLVKIFEVGGSFDKTKYCFLGDYVDRGSFSLECVLLLMALKLNYPKLIFMLRGNHESRQMTSYFNFKTECTLKYDEEVYLKLMDVFDCLPLAAVVNNKFFSVHGGISPSMKMITDIDKENRFIEVPKDGFMCDFLWADPIENEHEAIKIDWDENQNRGCSFSFGAKALIPYLNNNDLVCVIRAHEAQLEGFKMYKWNKNVDFPTCITVFSAPNYCDVYNNKAALIKFNNNVFNLVQFNCSPHPFLLPDFQNLFSWSLPFISEKSKIILI